MNNLQARVDELTRLEVSLFDALRQCSAKRVQLLQALQRACQERDSLAAEVERLRARVVELEGKWLRMDSI